MSISPDRFEPAIYSVEELQFLLDHLDKPAHAALHRDVPPGVNPVAITSALTQVQYYLQLEQYEGVQWAGLDAIRDSIERFLDWQRRTERIRALGGPPNPSMHTWDGDRNYRYGIGADSGELPRTEILDNGERRAFGVDLRLPTGSSLLNATSEMPWVQPTAKLAATDAVVTTGTKTHGALTCSICGKAEEFNPASAASKSAANARMGRHLKSARTDINRHRLLHRKLFQ